MENNYLEWFHRPAWQLLCLQQLITIPLLLGFYFFVWQDNQHKLHTLQSSITEQKHNAKLSKQRLSELPPLSELQKQIQQMTSELGQNNHEATEHTTVLKRLHLPLIRSGSQLVEWKSLRENNHVLWHLMLSLNYDQFLHFLNEIQQLQPPLLIKHLTIIPAGDLLTVRMVLSEIALSEMALSDTALPNMTRPNKVRPIPVHEDK
ncbi:hypothetical protein FE394_05825 [Xenorhabdus sp. Reich]|uniref:Uncharacterized protein n=1 Tax=Xenorhabdus littoralis TaxID=2582835 RepID=A0ABU4SJ89_9GAMM|nr:hypothetical protein [Xenorhabdus sp. Reich]MDX7998722.1 hypothetical protein [Xenorhabdus sp. Reich]